jgi:hypothetical protein
MPLLSATQVIEKLAGRPFWQLAAPNIERLKMRIIIPISIFGGTKSTWRSLLMMPGD